MQTCVILCIANVGCTYVYICTYETLMCLAGWKWGNYSGCICCNYVIGGGLVDLYLYGVGRV